MCVLPRGGPGYLAVVRSGVVVTSVLVVSVARRVGRVLGLLAGLLAARGDSAAARSDARDGRIDVATAEGPGAAFASTDARLARFRAGARLNVTALAALAGVLVLDA